MSQEATPERALPEQPAHPSSVPGQKVGGAPKGLLQQMEELMAALTADLSQLDADLQSSADRQGGEEGRDGQGRGRKARDAQDGETPDDRRRTGGLSF
ncbi:hypothetical protein [Streptomyces sp. NPDC053755]|uniref:hypothetical protein n=1 Tax=Streptomyces sp. NPDC053755 TaxID=3155815 RepID=UPI0034270EEF